MTQTLSSIIIESYKARTVSPELYALCPDAFFDDDCLYCEVNELALRMDGDYFYMSGFVLDIHKPLDLECINYFLDNYPSIKSFCLVLEMIDPDQYEYPHPATLFEYFKELKDRGIGVEFNLDDIKLSYTFRPLTGNFPMELLTVTAWNGDCHLSMNGNAMLWYGLYEAFVLICKAFVKWGAITGELNV